MITELNNLPTNLITLDCRGCSITNIMFIPKTLKNLNCENTKINQITLCRKNFIKLTIDSQTIIIDKNL